MSRAVKLSSEVDLASSDRITFTLFLATVIHGALIFGLDFTSDKGSKVAPTLNITLATHDALTPPEKADFIAQHNQEASGTESEVLELTTKDIATIQDIRIREVNPNPQQKASQQQIMETRTITTEANARHQQLTTQKQHLNNEQSETREGDELDTPLIDPEFASLQAKLDHLRQELARQPRIRRLTSVSTKASYDASYLNDWAQKIESIGNQNFPKAALREKIFGSLRLSVLILPDGSVENIEILQTSGHVVLDEAAMHIVRLSAPFQAFPKEIQKNTDKLEIIRTWRFEITGLKTTQ